MPLIPEQTNHVSSRGRSTARLSRQYLSALSCRPPCWKSSRAHAAGRTASTDRQWPGNRRALITKGTPPRSAGPVGASPARALSAPSPGPTGLSTVRSTSTASLARRAGGLDVARVATGTLRWYSARPSPAPLPTGNGTPARSLRGGGRAWGSRHAATPARPRRRGLPPSPPGMHLELALSAASNQFRPSRRVPGAASTATARP